MEEIEQESSSHSNTAERRNAQTMRVKLRDVVARKAWQVRARLNSTTVKQYLTAYRRDIDALPPVLVANVNGTLLLVDGWHRVEALKLLSRSNARAVVFEASEKEAQWEAAKANLTHGLPLKAREVRNVFGAYVRSKQHKHTRGRFKSYREIAADLANRVAYTTVRNWMKQDFRSTYEAMSEYGDEERKDWTGEPNNLTPRLTPLDAAIGKLDEALNEARSMPRGDREALAKHWRNGLSKVEQMGPWSEAEAVPDVGENDDF